MQWEREPLSAYMSIGRKKALFRERCNSEILRKANQKEMFFLIFIHKASTEPFCHVEKIVSVA